MLTNVRNLIQKTAPAATEAISYGIPTFKLNGKNLVHFAAYKTHFAFYPASEAIEVFKKDLVDFETSKGTIRFPLNKPLPMDLIKKITEFRVFAVSPKTN